MPPDASVPRLSDLSPSRQQVIRALLSAQAARVAEDQRAAAGLMTPDELAAYRDRRRTVRQVLDRVGPKRDRQGTTGPSGPVVDQRRTATRQVKERRDGP